MSSKILPDVRCTTSPGILLRQATLLMSKIFPEFFLNFQDNQSILLKCIRSTYFSVAYSASRLSNWDDYAVFERRSEVLVKSRRKGSLL